jgi:hypothetical protein
MSESSSDNPEQQERQTRLLTNYIDQGLAMIKSGQTGPAYEHFAYYKKEHVDDPMVSVAIGRTFIINKLECERNLISASRTIARHSWAFSRSTAEVGGWMMRQDYTGSDADDKHRYSPELICRLHHETSVIAAEEWLHMLQFAVEPTSLAGYDNVEVDVAACLDEHGIYLSPDFLTRYPERTIWSMEVHPERENEILDFIARNQPAVV